MDESGGCLDHSAASGPWLGHQGREKGEESGGQHPAGSANDCSVLIICVAGVTASSQDCVADDSVKCGLRRSFTKVEELPQTDRKRAPNPEHTVNTTSIVALIRGKVIRQKLLS